MENRDSEVKRKSVLLRIARIAVTMSLVTGILLWWSVYFIPIPGIIALVSFVVNIFQYESDESVRGPLPIALLGSIGALATLLYPVVNLVKVIHWKPFQSTLASVVRINILIMSVMFMLFMLCTSLTTMGGVSSVSDFAWRVLLFLGVPVTLFGLLAGAVIEVADILISKRVVKSLVAIAAGIVVLMVAVFAIVLTRPAPTPTSIPTPAPAVSTFDAVREFRYKGEAAAKKGDYDEAIANFSKAIELDPRNSDRMNAYSYLERGDAYYQKGSYDQAIADYDKLISLDPKFQGAYHLRGKAYQKKDNLDRAMADFNKALELSPTYAECYRDRGIAYRQQGLKSQAIADFQMYLTLNPKASDRAQVEQWIAELK